MVNREEIAARFWAKVEKGEGCWNWTASTQKGGYGQFGIRALRVSNFKATHVALWLATGEWPPAGVSVCHACDNPKCVRPDHLFLGTPTENMQDSSQKHRIQNGRRHWNARLTEAQVLEVRRLKADGLRNCEIVRKTGLTDRLVSRIVTGSRWKHLVAS